MLAYIYHIFELNVVVELGSHPGMKYGYIFSYIPRREMRSISSRGPIVFHYVLILGRKRILHFVNHDTTVTFFFPDNFLFADGRDGRLSKLSLNFFLIRYIQYFTHLQLNICIYLYIYI